MNKELYSLPLKGKKITDVRLGENYIEINFEGSPALKIEGFHSQDCCENVYADFSMFGYYFPAVKGKSFDNLVIKGVEEMGFLLCFLNDYGDGLKIFIPCYNIQNGYYSTSLELIITFGDIRKEIDISDFEEDNIC